MSINQDLAPQEYFIIRQNCPVCNSDQKTIAFKDLIHTCDVLKKARVPISNKDMPADIYLCRNCKHKYLSLVIKDDLLKYYYEVVGSEYYDSVKNNPYDRVAGDTEKFARLIKEQCADCSTAMEIGSGMGHLLFQLQQRGFECTGIEPSGFISEYSRNEFGLNVITGLLDYKTFSDKKFDVIILRDVIEHIYDVNSLFNLIEYYLAPEGRVIILTGDSNSLYAKICGKKWLYFFSWEHISFFNKSSIRYLLGKHGLSMDYFKKRRHSGSFLQNSKIFILTLRSMLANFFGFRNHKFFYMAFDHFIAIGKNKKK